MSELILMQELKLIKVDAETYVFIFYLHSFSTSLTDPVITTEYLSVIYPSTRLNEMLKYDYF